MIFMQAAPLSFNLSAAACMTSDNSFGVGASMGEGVAGGGVGVVGAGGGVGAVTAGVATTVETGSSRSLRNAASACEMLSNLRVISIMLFLLFDC